MKNHRRLLFWLAFFAIVGVVVAIPEFIGDNAPVVASDVRPVAKPDSQVRLPVPLVALRTVSAPDSDPVVETGTRTTEPDQPAATGLFAAKTWVVAPPPPPEPPPPPPSAPPLPFRLLGKLDDTKTVKAFLQKGEQVYTVSVGDVIDGTYRVDSIKTGQMILIYLPLSMPQTLIGGGES